MKILIVNTHSILNAGDAAIVLTQFQLLKNYFPELSVSITSRTPQLDNKIYKSLGIKVFPPIFPAPSVYSSLTQKFRQTIINLIDLQSKYALIKEMKECDLVIASGGGYFWTHRRFFPGPMFVQNYCHIELASQLHKPIVFFPQSFGPLRNKMASRVLLRLLESDYTVGIYAREKISLDFLSTLMRTNKSRVFYCPDLAFALDLGSSSEDSPSDLDLPKPVIALSLRQWDFPEAKNPREQKIKQDNYLKAFQKLSENIFQVLKGSILIFCQSRGPGSFEDDRILSIKLFENLKRTIPESHLRYSELQDTSHPLSIVQILKKADLLVATRFHSAIFALNANIPVISISYQPKSRGIMETLGLGHFCLDIAEFNGEGIFSLAKEIIEHSSKVREDIQNKISQIRLEIKTQLEKSLQAFLKNKT